MLCLMLEISKLIQKKNTVTSNLIKFFLLLLDYRDDKQNHKFYSR